MVIAQHTAEGLKRLLVVWPSPSQITLCTQKVAKVAEAASSVRVFVTKQAAPNIQSLLVV
jgi:hypothetical protein